MLLTVKRIAAALIAGGAAVTLATTAGATPAHAAKPLEFAIHNFAGNGFKSSSGYLWFYHYGEKLILADERADGAGVYGELLFNDEFRSFTNTNGNGTMKEWNLDFPEDQEIKFKVCLTDGGVVQRATCTGWVATVT